MQVKVKIKVTPFYHTLHSDDFQEAWEEHLANASDSEDWEYNEDRDGPPSIEFMLEEFEGNINDDSSPIEDQLMTAMLDIEHIPD